MDLLGRHLEFRGEIPIGDVNLGVISVWIVLTALRLDEINYRKSVDEREAIKD